MHRLQESAERSRGTGGGHDGVGGELRKHACGNGEKGTYSTVNRTGMRLPCMDSKSRVAASKPGAMKAVFIGADLERGAGRYGRGLFQHGV